MIKNASNLEELTLDGLPLENYGFLVELPHLRSLMITYPKSVADIPVSGLNLVEYLWLQGVPTDLRGLGEMSKLQKLMIWEIPSETFISINLPSSIEEFSVFHTAVDVSEICPGRLRFVHFGEGAEVRGANDLLSSPRLQFVYWTQIPDDIKAWLVAKGVNVDDG